MTIKDLINTIERKEWHFVIFLIIIVLVLTTGPYLYGYLNTPDNFVYRGIHSISPGDTYVYFSYINQIKSGEFLIENFYTSEPGQTKMLNFFWLKVGLLARIFNLSPNLAFQVFRIILIPIYPMV